MGRYLMWIAATTSLLLTVPVMAQSSGSGIFYWYDANGQLHVTDQVERVPHSHRAAAVQRERKGDTGPQGYVTQVRRGGSGNYELDAHVDRSTGSQGNDAQNNEAYWRERIQAEKDKKASAEQRLTQIEAEMIKIRAETPPGFQQSLFNLEEERQERVAEIAEASAALSGGIQEEARKAGALPGWLR